jgi:hypothetical protein
VSPANKAGTALRRGGAVGAGGQVFMQRRPSWASCAEGQQRKSESPGPKRTHSCAPPHWLLLTQGIEPMAGMQTPARHARLGPQTASLSSQLSPASCAHTGRPLIETRRRPTATWRQQPPRAIDGIQAQSRSSPHSALRKCRRNRACDWPAGTEPRPSGLPRQRRR